MDCFIRHSVARRLICGVVRRTELEAVIFVANATFSVHILSPSTELAWAGQASCKPPALLHKNAQYIRHIARE